MVEIPSIVMKVRKLLSVRSYTSDELLEYDDHYEMHPTRQVKGHPQRSAVWIFKEPRVVGIALVKDLIRRMEEIDATEGMLVGGIRFTPAAKKFARSNRVELVIGTYSSFDLFSHELVPDHVIADDAEVELILDHYGITKDEIPRILRDDPAAKVLGAKTGQVIRITRNSETAGDVCYYRLVGSSSS